MSDSSATAATATDANTNTNTTVPPVSTTGTKDLAASTGTPTLPKLVAHEPKNASPPKAFLKKYNNFPLKFIRNRLAQLGQSIDGLKPELLARLFKAEASEQHVAAEKAEGQRKQEELKKKAAAAAAAKARRKILENQDYGERQAKTDKTLRSIREQVVQMPTKLIRKELLNRGFQGTGKRKDIMGRYIRQLKKEHDEREKSKTAEQLRLDEIHKMQKRIAVQKSMALRRKKALNKIRMINAFGFGKRKKKKSFADKLRTVTRDTKKGDSGSAKPVSSSQRSLTSQKKAPLWVRNAQKAVTITTIADGDGTCCPQVGDTVLFHYTATLPKDGTEIDSSWKRHMPEQFVVGDGEALPCWEFAVRQVHSTHSNICCFCVSSS